MALQGWEKKQYALEKQLDKASEIINSLMISAVTGQGGSPGQLYKPPVTNPGRGEAVFGTEKDGQRFFEFLKAMKINPNSIMLPFVPKDAESDDDYGEGDVPGHPDWKLAGGPQLPNFKPMGRVIEGTRKGVLSPEENKIKRPLQIGPQASASSRQIRDRLKGFTRGGSYDEQGGSLRGVPDALRIQLLRDAMAQAPANNIRQLGATGHQTVLDPITGQLKIVKTMGPQAAANNITRFRPHGWRTDYTGSFRVGDDGKLIPQIYLHKINS